MKKRTAGFIEGLTVGLVGVIAGTAVSWFFLPGFRKNVVLAAINTDAMMSSADAGNSSGSSDSQSSGSSTGSEDENAVDQELVDKLQLLEEYINQVYLFDKADAQTSKDAIYKAYMDSQGDPYTVYYTEDEYNALMESTTGQYCGIGVEIQQDPETMSLTVLRVFSGSPAQEAGMKVGDVLLEADGTDISTMEIEQAVTLIRGEEGTTVHLSWYRPSTEETLEADVERREVEVETVSREMLDGNIGYIQVTAFDSVTTAQFEAALDSCVNEGAEGLIIDVRDNPGGLLTTVLDMCDYILPEGTVVSTKDKYGDGETYTSDDSHNVDLPIAVLVNGNSASASEIFAGAIQDRGAGVAVGTTTYGKGIVQSLFPLDDGSALKITVSNYYTPSGKSINGTGITPDIEVELNEDCDLSDTTHANDNQLEAAEEAVMEMIESGDWGAGTEETQTAEPETDGSADIPDFTDLDSTNGIELAEDPDVRKICA